MLGLNSSQKRRAPRSSRAVVGILFGIILSSVVWSALLIFAWLVDRFPLSTAAVLLVILGTAVIYTGCRRVS